MTKDEALKLALEALEKIFKTEYHIETPPIESLEEKMRRIAYKAIIAIKEALAQPEQLMSDQINYGMSVTQGGKRIDPMSIYKEPKQEPVTWRYKIVDVFGRPVWTLKTPRSDTRVLESQPLYTTPPQRKPLTDEEIGSCIDEVNLTSQYGHHHFGWHKQFARAIEAAHGIKELKEYKK